MKPFLRAGMVAACVAALASASPSGQERPTGQGFAFRTGVELVNVTVTVTDQNGRFVSGLSADDFVLYEDGKPQTIQQFDTERVPVSLGIALDTSGSMLGDKIAAAQAALNRFLYDLLGEQDEVFLFRFDGRPELVSGWTTDRRAVAQKLGSVRPNGGTAIYDTVAEAVPMAQSGSRRKKALVVISDGNDTNSRTRIADLQRLIRGSEVLVYAIGIDASGTPTSSYQTSSGAAQAPRSVPVPSPFPGRQPAAQPRPPAPQPSAPPSPPPPSSSRSRSSSSTDRVNPDALRLLTDESGGRTEIIVSASDLEPATAGIADELSRQYFLGYTSAVPKDGRWHTIDVQLRRQGNYTVRARRGFIAN